MKINSNNTKIIVTGKGTAITHVQINNEQIEQVHNFKYLGVSIYKEGNVESAVDERINSATSCVTTSSTHSLTEKKLSREQR